MNENYIEDWQYYKAGIISRKADCDNVLMTSTEAKRLFKRFGGLYIRWVSNFDTQEPSEFYSVIKDNKTDLEDYSSKVRNMIRRCINNCVVKIIDYHDIITGGGGGTKYIFLS